MKYSTIVVSTIFLMMVSVLSVNAQWTFPKDCDPEAVSATAAAAEAKTSQAACGFGSAFFHRKDIEELKRMSKCVGLRFYI
ncbi:MAG: hypothetical protein ACPGU4_08110, partial [Flavobacteriales bacterium]